MDKIKDIWISIKDQFYLALAISSGVTFVISGIVLSIYFAHKYHIAFLIPFIFFMVFVLCFIAAILD